MLYDTYDPLPIGYISTQLISLKVFPDQQTV